ncbi:MAG: hypothetical protein R2867_08155 [Caldilineaceae bacterium]
MGHPGKGGVEHTIGAVIAIVGWIADQGAGAVKQPKVDAPGVNANTCRCVAEQPAGAVDPMFDLLPQLQNIPMHGGRQAHGRIGKAMGFTQPKLATVKGADHGPATLCTKVKG